MDAQMMQQMESWLMQQLQIQPSTQQPIQQPKEGESK